MANVTIHDNTKYVELNELGVGDYFIWGGNLYLVNNTDCDFFDCFNLSNNELIRTLCKENKVIPVPSDKVKIKVEI